MERSTRIIFKSTFNVKDWTKKGKFKNLSLEFRTSQELRKKVSAWTLVILGPGDEDTWYGTHTCKPEGKWNTTAENMVGDFKETGHPIFPRYQCVVSRSLDKKRWMMYQVIHFTTDSPRCRAFVSHDWLSKPVQYLRSSSELVWRFGSADSWSNASDHGDIRRKGERSVISKDRSARCALSSTDTKDECSCSGRPTACSSWKIWWDTNNESLRICGIHEEPLIGAERSGFFGTNTREEWGSSRKPLLCVSSRVWRIGERGSIYESLRTCGVSEESLLECSTKTFTMWNDVFQGTTAACREYTSLR